MKIAEVAVKMIEYSNGNLHDINHFLKVYAFAKIIGEQEELPQEQLEPLEIAALVHDIACPLCREKYGNTNGKLQESEGESLARDFLRLQGLPVELTDRVVFLVAHHHTYTEVKGMDYQVLLEADYLVNACESGYSEENIRNALSKLFKTKTGSELLKSLYLGAKQ